MLLNLHLQTKTGHHMKNGATNEYQWWKLERCDWISDILNFLVTIGYNIILPLLTSWYQEMYNIWSDYFLVRFLMHIFSKKINIKFLNKIYFRSNILIYISVQLLYGSILE